MKIKPASTKEAIIGLRAKNIAMARIGEMLLFMAETGNTEFRGVRKFCDIIKSDPRTVNKHIGFRFYPQGAKEDYILQLDSEDLEVIRKTVETFEKLDKIGTERQKIAQYVFLYLVRSGQKRDSIKR